MNTNNLLTIGEMAKFTGASVYSLRYYERINMLTPAYIDPNSGYRYYSLEQTYLINIIKLCVELDIPLKEMTEFIDQDSNIDISALLAYGKKIARKKLKALEKGLRYIKVLEKQIAFSEKYQVDEIYSQELPEIKFYSVPYEKTFDLINSRDWMNMFSSIPYDENDYEYEDMPEFGLICKHTPAGIYRYAVLEVPKSKKSDVSDENIITMPGGTYFCMQSDESQIENAPEVFKEHIKGAESFLVFERAIISGRNKVDKLMVEVRVIVY